jgi:L-threonylcarbamoyladenylate synthase
MDKTYKKALGVLQNGGVITFPTDTVMGIGCSMNDHQAIKKLYTIKRRPKNQPTAVLVSDINMSKTLYGERMDKTLLNMKNKYWPGGLTIILKGSEQVPKLIMGNSDRIGVRIPDCPKLREMIAKLGHPVVATSANFKGKATPTKHSEIDGDFLQLVDYSIDEDSKEGEASTVIDYHGNGKFKILRYGSVTLDSKK